MNTWNANKTDLPRGKFTQTQFVWIKTKHKVYLASYHPANGLWYLNKDIHENDFSVIQDKEVIAWQPFAPPDDELNTLFVEMAARIEVIVGLENTHPDPYLTQDFKDGVKELLMRVRKKVAK